MGGGGREIPISFLFDRGAFEKHRNDNKCFGTEFKLLTSFSYLFFMCSEKYPTTPFTRPEVQGFISLLDSIINRMGSNSANAKNWLMTLIAAAIAIQWSSDQLDQVLWLLIPTFLFMLTDLYYLGMERHFRDLQKSFIQSVRSGVDISNSVYDIPKINKCKQICNTFSAMDSLSIWPFYLIVIGCILGVKYLT